MSELVLDEADVGAAVEHLGGHGVSAVAQADGVVDVGLGEDGVDLGGGEDLAREAPAHARQDELGGGADLDDIRGGAIDLVEGGWVSSCGGPAVLLVLMSSARADETMDLEPEETMWARFERSEVEPDAGFASGDSSH